MKQIKWIFLCLVFLCPMGIKAQYTLTAFQPPPQFAFEQLWHLSMTRMNANDGYVQGDFYLSLYIYDGQNALISKSNSSNFPLPGGIYNINPGNLIDIKPITTVFYQPGILESAIQNGGFFPAGSYNMVFALHGKPTDGGFIQVAESQFQTVVEVLFPPTLLTPADGDTVYSPFPVLTWTPAFSSVVNSFTYKLHLVEIMPGQTSAQALNANPLVFEGENLTLTSLVYPSNGGALRPGYPYAWQVWAQNSMGANASSEIWTFVLAEPRTQTNQASAHKQYYGLLPSLQGDYVKIRDGVLRFVFSEPHSDSDLSLNYTIYNSKGALAADYKTLGKAARVGHNQYEIVLCNGKSGVNLPDAIFLLKVVSQKGEKRYLRFHNDKSGGNCDE